MLLPKSSLPTPSRPRHATRCAPTLRSRELLAVLRVDATPWVCRSEVRVLETMQRPPKSSTNWKEETTRRKERCQRRRWISPNSSRLLNYNVKTSDAVNEIIPCTYALNLPSFSLLFPSLERKKKKPTFKTSKRNIQLSK